MGHYTELILGATFKSNTPSEVYEAIEWLIDTDKDKPESFKWDFFRSPLEGPASFYFAVSEPHVTFKRGEFISARCNIKNYDSEIETFIEWLKPYLLYGSGEKDLFAMTITEQQESPTLYYLSE